MKSTLILIIFNLMVVTSSHAQIIKKYYQFSTNRYANDLITCSDGGYLILAYHYLIRVDQVGEIIWEKPLNYYGSRIQETEGGFYVVGSLHSDSINLGCLVKINKQGDFLWSRNYQEDDYSCIRNIRQLSNNDLILSWEYRDLYYGVYPYHYTLRTDSLGNIIWSVDAYTLNTNEIFELDDHHIVFLGTIYRENQPPQFPPTINPCIREYTSDGIASSSFEQFDIDWATCNAATFDGEHYYFATDDWNYSIIQSTDSSVIWTKNYRKSLFNSICTDTNNIYLTGYTGNQNWSDLIILSMTNNGDSISTYRDDEDYEQSGKKIIIDDGYLVVLGQMRKTSNSSYGLTLTKIPISDILTSREEQIKNDFIHVDIYPNPSKNRLYVDLKTGTYSDIEIYVHNQQGSQVDNFTGSGSCNITEMNISTLKPGIYFISKYAENELIYSSRFIKQ